MRHQGTTLEREKRVTDPKNGEVIHKKTREYEPSDHSKSLARVERFTVIGNWIIGAITALLAARVLLNLLGANPEAGFSQFILLITQPFILPFTAMFASPSIGQSYIDSAALVGLVVYPVAGYGIVKLIKAIMAPSDPRGHAYTVS
jgi:hypothetical protein